MKGLNIHILKHAALGDAEEVLLEIIHERGHVGKIADPFTNVYSFASQAKPDAVIGRCELDSFADNALSAYLAFFDWCDAEGIPVVNTKQFLLSGQDKFITHLSVNKYLRSIGVEDTINPDTSMCFSRDRAVEQGDRCISTYGSAVIKKPHSGRGIGVFLAKSVEEIQAILDRDFEVNESVMIQQPIDKETNARNGFKDFRVWGCRNASTNEVELVNYYYRNGEEGEFTTNGSHGGGISEAGPIDQEIVFWTKHVMEALHGDVAGIDFARDKSGKLWLLEVNVAFETNRDSSLALFGNSVWEMTVDLAESRARDFKPIAT